MGDPARFRVLADYVADRWPDRSARIADVAGGKGYLKLPIGGANIALIGVPMESHPDVNV